MTSATSPDQHSSTEITETMTPSATIYPTTAPAPGDTDYDDYIAAVLADEPA